MKKNIGDIFNPPSPPALLFVDIFSGLPKTWRQICVHGYRIGKRNHAPVAIIIKETVPKDARVFRNNIGLPKADFNEPLKTHRKRRKRRETFPPLLLHHLPKSTRCCNNPR